MTQVWYYTKDGQTGIGPLTMAQMQEHARAGRLLPGDRVQNRDQMDWKLAVEVPGLFEPGGQTADVTGQRPATKEELLHQLRSEIHPYRKAAQSIWTRASPRTRMLAVGGAALVLVVLFLTCVGFFQFMLWW